MEKAVYKFHFDCGRMGELTGLFVESKQKIDWLIKSKLEVYFGEVLGKHSEIFDPVNESDFTMVSDDPKVISIIEENDLSNGFNPFDYTLLGVEEILGDKYEDDLTASEVFDKLHS